jgi:hypothetical protein
MSPTTRASIDELLKAPTVSSAAAREAAERIDPGEAVRAMDQLIAEMRKGSDWSKIRPELRGAVILARTYPEAATTLNRFLRGLPERPKWLGTFLKNETWAEID